MFENEVYAAERGLKSMKSLPRENDDRTMAYVQRYIDGRIKSVLDSIEKKKDQIEALEGELTELQACQTERERFEQLAFPVQKAS